MKKYMTPLEIEEYRRHVTGTFELYGFAGAMVSFTCGDDRSDLTAGPEKCKQVGPSEGYESFAEPPEDEVVPETLPQYRRFTSGRNFFKK